MSVNNFDFKPDNFEHKLLELFCLDSFLLKNLAFPEPWIRLIELIQSFKIHTAPSSDFYLSAQIQNHLLHFLELA